MDLIGSASFYIGCRARAIYVMVMGWYHACYLFPSSMESKYSGCSAVRASDKGALAR